MVVRGPQRGCFPPAAGVWCWPPHTVCSHCSCVPGERGAASTAAPAPTAQTPAEAQDTGAEIRGCPGSGEDSAAHWECRKGVVGAGEWWLPAQMQMGWQGYALFIECTCTQASFVCFVPLCPIPRCKLGSCLQEILGVCGWVCRRRWREGGCQETLMRATSTLMVQLRVT